MKLAYFPLFIRDFITDPVVLQMRWIDQAIYLRMLMASWEAGPLPDDATMIGRMIDRPRLEAELEAYGADLSVSEAIQGVLESCWELTDAGWVSPRMERERSRALALVKRQSEGGSEGNARRWGKNKPAGDRSDSDRSPIGKRSDTDRSPIARAPEPDPEIDSSSGPSGSSLSKSEPPSSPPTGGASPKERRSWRGSSPDDLADAWGRWLAYRRERRKPVGQTEGDLALRELASWGPERAAAAIDHAISRGWSGFREPAPGRILGAPGARSKAREPSCAACGTTRVSLTRHSGGDLCFPCLERTRRNEDDERAAARNGGQHQESA